MMAEGTVGAPTCNVWNRTVRLGTINAFVVCHRPLQWVHFNHAGAVHVQAYSAAFECSTFLKDVRKILQQAQALIKLQQCIPQPLTPQHLRKTVMTAYF
jgi:hypothetical protein